MSLSLAFPTLRLRFACSTPLKYGANAAAQFDDPDWPRFVRITDITDDGRLKDETFRSLPPEEAAPYLLDDGDVLLARSGSIGRSFIYRPEWGTVCHAGYLIRARLSQRFDPKFVYWALNSSSYWAWIEGIAIRSTIQNVSAEKYADYAVPAPPLETQKRIAAFLDEKTARIDALIAKKQALLERLAEKRQAIITQAVTKGLNPAAPMKDSGIDWLGQIPVHWEVKPFKRAVFYQEGPGIMAADFHEEGVPLLRVASVGGRWATLDGVNYLHPELVEKKWSHFLTKEGDLLISASATSGIVSEVGEDTVGCIPYTGIIRLNPKPNQSVSNFIRHFVVSRPFIAQIDQLKAGSTIQHFGPYHLGLMTMAVPPTIEQAEIGAFLDDALTRSAKVEQEIAKSLNRLAEYRSALITAAVTGQIAGLQ